MKEVRNYMLVAYIYDENGHLSSVEHHPIGVMSNETDEEIMTRQREMFNQYYQDIATSIEFEFLKAESLGLWHNKD